MPSQNSTIALSIVIAAWRELAGLAECLDALDEQRDAETQVIVASTEPIPPRLASRFPYILWYEGKSDALIPDLWGLGMVQATSELVAITTSQFQPAADWIDQIRRAHAELPASAIGGAIDPPARGSATAWATYFLRYSQYLRYTHKQPVDELAGDNASYKRRVLTPAALRHGFWELEFHRRLLASGEELLFAPDIRVRQQRAFGFWEFVAQRIRHGRKFGRDRARRWGPARRAVFVGATPLVPIVLVGKVLTRVGRGGRHFGQLARALAVLCCFIAAWSLGEAWGYLSTPDEPGTLPSPARRPQTVAGPPAE